LPGSCANGILVDFDYLTNCGCTVSSGAANYINTFSIQDGWGIFHNPKSVPDQDATLSYEGRVLDEEGRFKMYKDKKSAVFNYCCWKFSRRFDFNFKEARIKEYKDQWVIQSVRVNANEKHDEFMERREAINTIMNKSIFSGETLMSRP